MVWAEILEICLNVVEGIALVASVVTFLTLLLNKFSRGLREVLAPCGLQLFQRWKVVWICRQSYLKKRAFIEFALLKTQGCPVIPSEWNNIINEFKSFFVDAENGHLTYPVPNVTFLTGRELNEAIGRYFEFLKDPKVNEAFGIRGDVIKWVIKIRVNEVYVTPTCLLTGLLYQYEDNWETFIKKYVSTAYMTEQESDAKTRILPRELYFTFAWLLWGPSYELDYKKYWAGLCQLAYGDESNSLPAVADRESNIVSLLRNKIEENESTRYGALMSADISLYDKKPYFREIRDFENPQNVYFYEKINDGESTFIAQMDGFTPCDNYKAKKYYYTAYVWLLFELEDDTCADFRPEKTVAFFEHANLTDHDTYSFLVDTLIDKSIKHFTDIFSDGEYQGRKYRFVAALNHRIEARFQERFRELMAADTEMGRAFRERVLLDPKREPSMVFSSFDTFFSSSDELEYIEVSLDNKESIKALGEFYTEIYIDCFPDPDERETFDSILAYLAAAEKETEHSYHVLLLKNKDTVLGGAIFDYFHRINSAVIEFIAVKKQMQSSGLGAEIFKQIQIVLANGANAAGKKNVDHIFCEIDSPEYSTATVKKYLYFWDKNHFKHICFDYVQPALSVSQQAVTGLWLAVLTEESEKGMDPKLLADFLYDYMFYCMRIEDPAAHPDYIAMKKAISSKKSIDLCDIIPKE